MAARLGLLNTTLQGQVAENERLQRQQGPGGTP